MIRLTPSNRFHRLQRIFIQLTLGGRKRRHNVFIAGGGDFLKVSGNNEKQREVSKAFGIYPGCQQQFCSRGCLRMQDPLPSQSLNLKRQVHAFIHLLIHTFSFAPLCMFIACQYKDKLAWSIRAQSLPI